MLRVSNLLTLGDDRAEEYCVDAREQNRTEKFTDDFRQLRCKQIYPNQLYFHSYAIRTGRQFDI
jgi:hypothetical protein